MNFSVMPISAVGGRLAGRVTFNAVTSWVNFRFWSWPRSVALVIFAGFCGLLVPRDGMTAVLSGQPRGLAVQRREIREVLVDQRGRDQIVLRRR